MVLKILPDGAHTPGARAPPVHHSVDVLVIGSEPHVFREIALVACPLRAGGDNTAQPKFVGALRYALNVLQGVLNEIKQLVKELCSHIR